MRCRDTQNIYKMGRLEAGKSRLDAAWELHIANSTLERYETDKIIPPPGVVDSMAELYGQKELTAVYCSEICPIGKKYAYHVERKDLALSVLGLLKEDKDFDLVRDRLIAIASDGVITENEIPEFRRILGELMDIEQRIETIKLWATAVLPVEEMVRERKEKTASRAAI